MVRTSPPLLATCVFALMGCSESPTGNAAGDQIGETNEISHAQQTASIDPVVAFKELVPRHPEIRIEDLGSDRFVNEFVLTNFAYDVRKSDSLVSPLIGDVVCDFQLNKRDRKSEYASKESGKMKMSYAFQDGKWVATGLTFKFDKWNEFRTVKFWFGDDTEKLISDRWRLAAEPVSSNDAK